MISLREKFYIFITWWHAWHHGTLAHVLFGQRLEGVDRIHLDRPTHALHHAQTRLLLLRICGNDQTAE